jgi:hypothetical protein
MYSIKKYWIFSNKLKENWLRMEASEGVSPFCYYSYIRNVFWHTFFFKPFEIPIIYVLEENAEILLIAPVKYDLRKKSWFLLGDIFGSGEAGFLYKKGLSSELLYTYSKKVISEFQEFTFSRVAENSILSDVLYSLKCSSIVNNSVFVNVPRTDYGGFMKKLSSSVRQNLRTAYNRMQRDGVVHELVVFKNNTMSSSVYNEIMDVYLGRQRGKYGNHNGIARVVYSFFYKHLKHDSVSLKQNENAIHFVFYVNNEIAAFFSGFKTNHGDRIVVPRLAINDKYQFYSPGYLLLNEALQYLAKEGEVRYLDLTRGTERYKIAFNGVIYNTIDYTKMQNLK